MPPAEPGAPSVTPPPPRRSGPTPADLPGWAGEDHLAALRAWSGVCGSARDEAYRPACDAARAQPPGDAAAARSFFETWFVIERGEAQGVLTAYFAPEYEARSVASAEFSAPVLARPDDLMVETLSDAPPRVMRRGTDGATSPYPARAAIEAAPPSQTLAWMRPEDLFFMQIQGSGYLTFEDGARARAAFAAHNGHGFVGIARPMAEQGLLPQNGTSGEAIRAWLAAHRGPEADAVMDLNPRYVFFALQPDDGGHPLGAAGVPLPPARAVAIDPAHWTYGDLIWIDAPQGDLIGAERSYRGLVTALDTGGAIRGPVRADLYLGRGDAAGLAAGRVRHPLRMWRLTPRPASPAAD
ncbi:MltA domain-containing protein [Brevundimonas sp.]|uniref:MltA domain-containing protein n=1 Tax=Brevundimonas sp. TaxID=1871086 RepID=UPI0025FE4D18|nr:MltA domain-containing protein [Brevundimonas sp.]